ncbi:MAG: nucleotidyltransferase family protein [Actinomycetota bacterium]|nr:nucleotidyltransferase family protein [Actinomycetota bacterium]
MTSSTTAVLLAAGAGTRLGRGPKALLPYRGRTLVEHLAQVLREGGCRETVVVLGAGAAGVRARTDLAGHRVLDNPRWQEGMSTSFSLGVAAVPAGDDVLVALVDQPGVSAGTVARLLSGHRAGRVTMAAYLGPDGALQRGHPVLFDGSLAVQAAAEATGDGGARNFLRDHPGLIDLVECGDPDEGADVDTADQLHLLD